MKKREQYKHLLNGMAGVVLLVVQALLFSYIWYQIYIPEIKVEDRFWNRGNWAVIGMYVLLMFFFTHIFGGYKIGYLRITDICLSNVLAIVCVNIVEYFQLCMITNDYLPIEPLIGLAVVEVIIIIPYVYIIRWIYVHMYPPRKMIVVYGQYLPNDLISKINTRKDKYNICASVSYEIGYEKLYSLIKQYSAVVLFDLPSAARNQIMKFCYQNSVRTYVTPKISDIIIKGADDIHLFDTPLLLSRNQGLLIEQRFVKRTCDILLSLVGILIASPFMLLIAIAVKLYDGGPILYKQDRLTRDGKSFMIYKFRSMSMDSEKNGARLAAKGDKRVTPVGKIIRNIHFDELPQLFNILKGDMSMVGPRPERKEISDKYEQVIPEFVLRTKVKAGLTGYAQVYGKYNTTPYDKLKLDLTYIENYSLWLDVKIMLLTFKILFQKENTEGVDEEQTTAMK